MNIVITEYVEKLFQNAPQTRDILDIKEELLYNLNEKFEDLVKNGMNKEDAFLEVTAGIGNIQELILEAQKPKSRMYNYDKPPAKKDGIKTESQKAATNLIVSSMWMITGLIYILMILYGHNIFGSYVYTLGWLIFLVAVAVQAAFFIVASLPSLNAVNAELYMPASESDRILLLKRKKKIGKRITGHVSTIIWMAAVSIYMVVSFLSGAWRVTWIIFILAVVIQNFIIHAIKLFLNRVG